MFKEVNREQLLQDLANIQEAALHQKTLGENLGAAAKAISDAVETLALTLPAEGVDTIQISVSLFNAMVDGLKEVIGIIGDEGYTNDRRYSRAMTIYNGILNKGLAALLPPPPALTPQEMAKREMEAEKWKRKMIDGKLPPVSMK